MNNILTLIREKRPGAILFRTITYLSTEGSPRLEVAIAGDQKSVLVAHRPVGQKLERLQHFETFEEATREATSGVGPYVVAEPNDPEKWERGGELRFFVLIENNPLRIEVRPPYLDTDGWRLNWPGMGSQSLAVTAWFNRALNYAMDRAANRSLTL